MKRTVRERDLTNGLLRITRLYRREIDRRLAANGLTEARALPLLQIARLGDGVRQGVLADALGLEGPSLVGLLDQLCAAGLVERRDDPDDRRAKTLHLTGAGRALAAIVEPGGDQLRAELLAGVSDDELDTTLRVFAAFERALQGSTPGQRPTEP